MAQINKGVKGTNDVLPQEVYRWQFVEKKMLETARQFGFREVRIPVFEHTEVFSRGVGDTTDVVQKEMYTFDDKGGRSLTLRPEFTAGVMRSMIEHGQTAGALPLKVCYIGACYRYEKPQAGRLREFHQFGVECLGTKEPMADAEVIALAKSVLYSVGITQLSLEINSIGCPKCRAEYNKALKAYFAARVDDLCGTCKDRLDRNPMRILDCKSPICKEIGEGAPLMLDYLCDECKEHFEQTKTYLNAMGIQYRVNPRIVRGLDYYTKTVFEFISDAIGAQGTVCGGGRYDGLSEQLGGPNLPSLGFAMGIERLLMVMDTVNAPVEPEKPCDVYIAPMGQAAQVEAARLCTLLREEGFAALTDVSGRGLKAQMKYADKIGAQMSMVIGDNELEQKQATLKNMRTGESRVVTLPNGLLEGVYDLQQSAALADLTEAVEKI